MIFVIVGSQKFQFNRLIQHLDKLVETGVITDTVFAQIGASDYQPTQFESERFLDRTVFAQKLAECDVVVTHGGTGAIVGALKQGKKVIAVPRLAQYGEHVDDHQLEIIGQFENMGMLSACYELDALEAQLAALAEVTPVVYQSNTQRIMDNIKAFVEGE